MDPGIGLLGGLPGENAELLLNLDETAGGMNPPSLVHRSLTLMNISQPR